MKPSAIGKTLKTMYKVKHPTFIWGPPGVGKSDVVNTVAQELGIDLIDIRALLFDPVDVRGLPFIDEDKKAAAAIPQFLPTEGNGILFLDELPAAAPAVQASFYQLILDRKLGDYELPEGWVVFAAGNRQTDRAISNHMPSALSNRFTHIEFDVHHDDWTQWAITNGISTEVISYLRFRPDALHMFKPEDRAFATPRSWAFVSKLLHELDSDVEAETLSGTVGEGAAAEFMGFLKVYRNLPDPDAVLMSPATSKVPEDPQTLYALSGALANRATENNIERLVEYSFRMPSEFQVVTIRDAVQRNADLARTKAFKDWCTKSSMDIL